MSANPLLAAAEARAAKFSLELGAESWFELMHWHPDIDGAGNAEPDMRKFFLALGRRYLDTAASQLASWAKPSQCWFIAERDRSSEDAIYVHTPNPNRDNFPYRFPEVVWQAEGPRWLAEQFPASQFKHGISHSGSVAVNWAVPRGAVERQWEGHET